MIALPKLENRSAETNPSKMGPAWDGAPISDSAAPTNNAIARPLVKPEPRRPVKAATIIRIVPPSDNISSGRMAAKRPISALLEAMVSRERQDLNGYADHQHQ